MRIAQISVLARTGLAVAPLLLLAAGPARAQIDSREAIALRNDIYQLQQEIQALRQQVGNSGSQSTPTYLGGGYSGSGGSGSSGGSGMVAQLLSRVASLSDQVRDLRGQVQEAENEIQQQKAELSKRIDDLAFQVQHPGLAPSPGLAASQGPGASAAPAAAQPTTSPPPAPLGKTQTHAAAKPAPLPRTPAAAMKDGNAALARHDYQRAEAAAREVLNKFRTSPRAYDAQFLLAEALAGLHDYPRAAIAYDDAYNRSRKGDHAPQALLGLASSLTAINEKKAACDTLAKLHTEFPHEHHAVRQAEAHLRQRAGCK